MHIRLVLPVVLLAVGIPGKAQAQFQGRAPWCAYMGGLGTYYECHYYSLAQCMQRASGISNGCSANPWYVPGRSRRDIRRQRYH